jgi:hypothetical protein
MNPEEFDDSELQNEIDKIEYEMNAVSPEGDLRNEFIESQNAENIKKLILSLEVAHKLLKKHAQIITIQQLNTNALYDESQRHKKILIAMSILIIALGIKTIFF